MPYACVGGCGLLAVPDVVMGTCRNCGGNVVMRQLRSAELQQDPGVDPDNWPKP